MNRNLLWKTLFVIFVVAWSLWEIYPPTPRNLIDEFENSAVQVDTNFTAIVDQARQLQKENTQSDYLSLQQAIGTNDVTRYFPSVKVKGESNPTRAVLNQVQKNASGTIKLGLDLQGGTSFLVGLDTSRLDTNRVSTLEERELVVAQAIEVLRRRVDRFGVAEPIIQPVGDNRISIQLPGLSEVEKESAKSQIQRAAFLEFRMVHERSRELLAEEVGAAGYEVLTSTRKRGDGQEEVYRYLVRKGAELGLTGNFVRNAMVTPDPISNQPEISLSFDSKGAELFARVTSENVGRELAIVLDGQLYSAPVIQVPILDGNAVIEGNFSLREAYELANVLENPLEAPLKIEQEHTVSASLGRDSIRSGIQASIIGAILVSGFMLIYYLLAGLIANVALMLNIIILLGVMCSINTTLTLPGIAGIVLTMGMAVDANVLIFERIREELAAGKSMRGALSAGYDKAFGTIFDSNVTTLISSVILIFMGSGPVKGFGVTLTIGVAASMFTALVVTRLFFDAMLKRGWLKTLPMLRLLKRTHLDFLRWSKPAFAFSWMLVLFGVVFSLYRGKESLGIDFRGGDRITLSFAQRVDVGQVRDAVVKLGVGEPMIQYPRDLQGNEHLEITTAFESATKVEEALKAQFPEAKFQLEDKSVVGPVVALQILKAALIALFLALLGILIYVAMRYEFSFALGAVVAVVHDALMTLGWFCLSGREFSAPMVAAVLTIIGFSINDTIVIFDRIREDLKLGVRGTFKDVINDALNKTLSRTIITSGTVFLATSALYLFGGSVINDFAFTMLAGIIVGTYSSIYIASAFVLWWHRGERPKTSSQVIMDSTVAAQV